METTPVLWVDQFLSTVFQCWNDEYYGTLSLIALYYMLYKYVCSRLLNGSNACCKQFRDEGCIPDLVMLANGKSEGEIVPEDTVQLAKKVLDKIALEGGKEALQSHLWNRFTVGTSPAASCCCCSTAPISPSA